MTLFGLAEVPLLKRHAWHCERNLGGVISEGRYCDLGNFLRTRLSGKRLFGATLAGPMLFNASVIARILFRFGRFGFGLSFLPRMNRLTHGPGCEKAPTILHR